jgi:hypothetical protein
MIKIGKNSGKKSVTSLVVAVKMVEKLVKVVKISKKAILVGRKQ